MTATLSSHVVTHDDHELVIISSSHTDLASSSFPAPNVASGSFVADLDLGLPEPHSWKPTKEELMVISAQIHRLAEQELPFQRLTIDTDTALAMFEENPHKTGQIPNIADKRGKLTVYKVGP